MPDLKPFIEALRAPRYRQAVYAYHDPETGGCCALGLYLAQVKDDLTFADRLTHPVR